MSKINSLESFQTAVALIQTKFVQRASRFDFNRINIKLLDLIKIDYFGEMSALAYAVSHQNNPDGSVLLTPHVPGSLEMIYQAILNSKTNWNVVVQKDKIRITPRLITTDAKNQAQKEVQKWSEDVKVGIRQFRHELLKFWKKADISENERSAKEKQLQQAITTVTKKLELELQKQLNRIKNF